MNGTLDAVAWQAAKDSGKQTCCSFRMSCIAQEPNIIARVMQFEMLSGLNS